MYLYMPGWLAGCCLLPLCLASCLAVGLLGCQVASSISFSPMATQLCMKRPKMDLTFFKSCALVLKHFQK